MNSKTFFTLATALIAIASAASAIAGDDRRALNSQDTGAISAPFISTLTRAQVRAETLEAIRIGAINYGGDYSPQIAPTAKQLDSIRMAGQKAMSQTVASL